jgi:hypothetical protein
MQSHADEQSYLALLMMARHLGEPHSALVECISGLTRDALPLQDVAAKRRAEALFQCFGQR